MKTQISKVSFLLNISIALIIFLVPFQAFLTVWVSSNFGHYTGFRLWDEVVFLITALLALYLLALRPKLRSRLLQSHLFWLILAYAVLSLVIGVVSFVKHDVTAKALGYGLIVNLRFPIFLLICLVAAAESSWLKNHWRYLVLIPAGLVVLFGLAQHFILPYDFLRHFGYSAATIFPYETINHNLTYIRVMSTLRGSNPLGAYLVVVVTLLSVLTLREKSRNWRLGYGLMLVASLGTLFFSYSRSAWIGAGLGVATVVLLGLQNERFRRWLVIGLGAAVIIVGLSLISLRNNVLVQNALFHSQTHSAVATSSDQGHLSALKSGLSDAVHEPLGRGPGTAGPASTYNYQTRIAEDYFIQIVQEVGWIGLVLFVLINWLVVKNLWLNRVDDLALGLLAAMIGLVVVNLLSHAWVDDSLSYIWWGLAGIELAPLIRNLTKEKN